MGFRDLSSGIAGSWLSGCVFSLQWILFSHEKQVRTFSPLLLRLPTVPALGWGLSRGGVRTVALAAELHRDLQSSLQSTIPWPLRLGAFGY